MIDRDSTGEILERWPEFRARRSEPRSRLKRLCVLLTAFLSIVVLTFRQFPSPAYAVGNPAGLMDGGEPALQSGASTFLGCTSSCSMPSNHEERSRCRRMEDNLLKATVRFVIETWRVKPREKGYTIASTVGHGTVKDGRFLVTHNHFDDALSLFHVAGKESVYTRISIYDASGRLLWDGPMAQMWVATEGAQMLILDFQYQGGRPFFEALGFASADFLDSAGVTLRPGTQVAQLDWDGTCSRIEWTTVKTVDMTGDAPHLHLADPIQAGASGGGVFWNGYHVANNWTRRAYFDGHGKFLGERSTAALNLFSASDRR